MNWIQRLLGRFDRQLIPFDFWSDTQEELQVTSGGTTETLPSVTIADLPDGATIVRAIAIFFFRMVENTHAGVNAINAAQHIQVQKAAGTWRDAISIADTLFTFTAAAREGGTVMMGDHNIAVEVDANAVYNFQWLSADSLQDFIQFNECVVGLRIWYSV